MADMKVIRCRDCIHGQHRDDIEQGNLACMVREGLCGFIVPEDGFCFLAEARRNTCGECRFFRMYQNKDPHGNYWDGLCCENRRHAHGADVGSTACERFKPMED